MPGRLEAWSRFVREAGEVGLDGIVCLTPLHEVQRLSPSYHQAIAANTLPCRFTHLPMRDFGVPDQLTALRSGLAELVVQLRAGESLLLHCAAGIGRTGTTAACLLKSFGLSSEQAIAQVQAAGSNPETAVQSGLIDSF